MASPHFFADRRQVRTNQLLWMTMKALEPFIRRTDTRDVARALESLFYTQGVQVITEAERITAGLEPRDDHGLTMTEVKVIETHQIYQMSQALGEVPKVILEEDK